MTPLRAGVSLLLIGLVCLAVVVLRSESVRFESRAQDHVARLLELRREAWNIQAQIARLRTPDQIRERVEHMGIAVQGGAQLNGPVEDRARFAQSGR